MQNEKTSDHGKPNQMKSIVGCISNGIRNVKTNPDSTPKNDESLAAIVTSFVLI